MNKILSLELTTHCQQNCLHCFARQSGMEFAHMPFEHVLAIMEEGGNLGFKRLHLTGGEVLLYPHFFDIITKAKDYGFSSIFINTNGHLLDESVCRKLSGVDGLEFSLSLNGPIVYHDFIRGEGAYEKAVNGMRHALEQDLKIHIFTVVSRKNLDILPEFTTDLFREYKTLKDITFIQLRSGPEGEEDKLRPEEYISFVRMTALLGLAGLPVHILENPLSTAAVLKIGYTHLPPSPPISRDGKMIVLVDGRISDNHSSSVNLGKYTRGCLGDLLESEKYRRCWIEKKEICGQCSFFDSCRAGGLLRPSDEEHNTRPYNVPFCQKVMSLL